MASPHQLATIEKLPEDVLTNIFIRLLAKQLSQMRCVSKSWNAFLSRSSFVKSHLRRSTENNDEVLLVFYPCFSFSYEPFTAHPSRSPHHEVTDFIKLPVSHPKDILDRGSVIGSVNGLVCFKYESSNGSAIHIWNPSLSAVSTLPPYSMPSHSFNDSIEVFFKFGFDPESDDYKVVKLTSVLRPPTKDPEFKTFFFGTFLNVVKEWLQTEVYSMRKGFWELIPEKPPSHVTRIFDQDEVFGNGHVGHLHWLCYIDEERKSQTILTFDLGVETFCEISLPDSIQDQNRFRRDNVLGVLSGKLCVMSCVKDGDGDGDCEVWVMDEYGVAESWVKLQIYSHYSGDIAPFGFTLHNEFIFQAYSNRLVLYDPVAAKSKSFNVMARILGTTKIVQYVDSLVWVAPSEHEISCCSISQLEI